MKGLLITLFWIALTVSLLVSLWMLVTACRKPRQSATLIVLGCRVYGNTPGRMLKGRLDAALRFLNAYPDAACIVSGGQGEDEICTEASVMAAYLMAHGIDKERVYQEDRSKNTCQNLSMSAQIIKRQGLDAQVAIASDGFHQLRGQLFAKQNHLQVVGAVTCKTPWYRLLYFWPREVPAIFRACLLKR